jgi:hypothetical protein
MRSEDGMFIGDTSACTKASGLPFLETAESLISALFASGIVGTRVGPTAIRSTCVRIADAKIGPRVAIGV